MNPLNHFIISNINVFFFTFLPLYEKYCFNLVIASPIYHEFPEQSRYLCFLAHCYNCLVHSTWRHSLQPFLILLQSPAFSPSSWHVCYVLIFFVLNEINLNEFCNSFFFKELSIRMQKYGSKLNL